MAEYCVKSRRIPPKSEWLAAMYSPCRYIGRPLVISYLTSHILGKSRKVVSRCLPPGVFTKTPSPASVSFTIRPSSSLFRDVGFAYTGENSVVHHALSFHRGTTCRWRGGQLRGRGFLRRMPPISTPFVLIPSGKKYNFTNFMKFKIV